MTAVLNRSSDPAIYVMGKADSVSAAVVDALSALDGVRASDAAIHRVAGNSRYATSALAARAAGTGAAGPIQINAYAPLPTAILASGTSNADALAAGPLSNAWGAPILLTGAHALAPETSAVIRDLGIKQLIVLGGTDRVAEAALSQAKAAGVLRTYRIAGANRYATAAKLYATARTSLVGPDGRHYSGADRAFLANGTAGFPDALAVGPLAAQLGAPLLTVAAGSIDTTALDYLAAAKESLAAVTALGSEASVGDVPLIAAKAAIAVNLRARSDGTIDPALDIHAQFLAAAGTLTSFEAKMDLARTYLPDRGARIGTMYPYMLKGYEDSVGVVDYPDCDIYMNPTQDEGIILDTLLHEYIHVLQCRAWGNDIDFGYAGDDDHTEIFDGIERGADVGTYLLGGGDLNYIIYGKHPGPIQASEIVIAQRVLAYFSIPYRLGG